MVATGDQGAGSGVTNVLEERLDALQGRIHVQWVDRSIANVGDATEVKRRRPGEVMGPPDQSRHLADLCRAVARAGAKRRAAVEGHAAQCDVEAFGTTALGGSHQGGDLG